jgi:integrase
VRPLPPAAVERIRTYLLQTDRRLDATLVSVLAYAGLRPGEAIGLRWNDVGERTLLVERSVAFGQIKSTKTASIRSVKLLSPLKEDLLNWRTESKQAEDLDLIFPSPDGSTWNADRAPNWRNRAFAEAAEHAEVAHARPYDLRHSFVSLLIAQGTTVVEVARQAGHAPTMTLSTYAHLFDELDEGDHRPAADQIWEARSAQTCPKVSVLCPRAESPQAPVTRKARFRGASAEPSHGLEPWTPSLPWKCSTN